MHPASLGEVALPLSSLPHTPWAPGLCWCSCESPELTQAPGEEQTLETEAQVVGARGAEPRQRPALHSGAEMSINGLVVMWGAG